MRYFISLVLILFIGSTQGFAQKPAYCDNLPVNYDQVTAKNVAPRPKLPKFGTQAVTEYKVQVAILKFTDPAEYPFHSKLLARYRPCEEVWVIESRETFKTKAEAQRLQRELQNVGYSSAYLVECIGYQ
ncbi:MAG: hypothetical protein D6772_15225 [Bacteroidetes bacterium]|nr:MAG: hypothetical protein D6772_15225 [Bacteroidota bacterium]